MQLLKYKLGELLDVSRGASLSGEFYSSEGELIRLTLGHFDYQNGGFKENTSKDNLYFVGPVKSQFILNEGDIITPLTEQTPGLLGSTAMIPESGKYIQSQDVALIRCKEDKLDSMFCYYLLPSKIVKSQLGAAAQQTKIRHTTPDRIKDVIVFIPELEEQRRIGATLHSIDRKIALNREINRNLEAMARQLYDYWFVQFDFPDENGRPYKSSGGKMVWNERLKREIPENWDVITLADIVTVKDGTHDSPKPTEDGMFLITSKHLTNNGIDFGNANYISIEDFEAINRRSKVETGDILFSMIGTIGNKYHVFEKEIAFAIKNMALIKSSSTPEIQYYIWHCLSSIDYLRYEPNALSGSIQKFLSLDAMRNIPILFNENMCMEFNSNISNMFVAISNNQNQISVLSHQRDELLPLLMNGQVSVTPTEVNCNLSHD